MAISKFDYTKISDDCVKCGKCKPVCTIFNINQDEATSPRGFIDLLGAYKRDELELDKNAKDIFESCFLCTNCVEVCPNDLPTDMIIEQVRSDIAKKYGIAWYKRLFFFLLRHRKTMDFLSKLGWVFQTCALKLDSAKQSALPRFSLPIVKKGRVLPYADKRSFLNKYPENIPAINKSIEENKKGKVAIFIGCMSNYTYTNTGDSLVKILKKLNLDITIPKKQLCCGAPAYFTGAFDTVDYLVKENIKYFETWIDEVDAVIIPEATCSAMINKDWEHYLHDQPEWKERAVKLSKKIFLATKWLENNTELKELLAKSSKKFDQMVTYHDPCHAKKMQGVWKEPRELLKQNYVLKEMSDSNRCCGFGGVTMQTEKYEFSKAAGAPKAAMIRDTKAQIVSAECSACRMQITNSLYLANVDVEFKNPIELIAQALED
ncbi:(Fe-S)-binding protein [Aliarcobacter butzleri]|uniref:Glycolate oxidase iron-sulfur subunit n=1 Tax=Aliarcobacter butzleri L352 TaxID=1447260 RepID=A0A837JCK9_9BACT|nr:(Fe-S)-binding protein [Aliarcobacter butzleri]KLE05518.1 glycerol-3-phosphate dehydrogenase subunit C [Aliarcobacter butzleri L352]MCG3684638.1 (Fe-S)-binding protein [Aliarcobacter butzleri]MCT7601430.1 (Fe-S)-binding protein [Aliarcobacter butzleri]MCT7605750.1 (Fe-S)-binding protein [Aliarcobacter butzleri]MCT7607829.1 (Fe-S)-binding protein [Aliarcobacter butzleri]